MNPKAICADMAFHHPHDMQAFHRIQNVKRLPTGSHTPWPNRAEMGVRLFKKFLSALVDTASRDLDQTPLSQITPAQLMRKAATLRNTQVTLSGKTLELAMGRRPRDLMDSASMHPEQLTSTQTNQDLLNEEIQKLAMKTHLEVQQREDIRRDRAERMKFVPPDLRTGEHVFHWQKDPSKIQQGRKSGRWLKVQILAVTGCMVVISTGASIFQVKASKLRRLLDTVDLEELPDSREHTGALVLWLSSKGRPDVWKLFSDNSYLSAILDRQGPPVPVPVDRKKNSESFSPQLFQGCGSKLKDKIPKIVVLCPTVTTKNSKQKEVIWEQYRLCLAVAEYQICCVGLSCVEGRPSGSFIIWAVYFTHLDLHQSHASILYQQNLQIRTVLGDCISRTRILSIQAPQYRQHALISDFLDLALLSLQKEAALATNWIKDRLERFISSFVLRRDNLRLTSRSFFPEHNHCPCSRIK